MNAVMPPKRPALGFGFSFADLATRDGLVRLDRAFLERLAAADAALHARLLAGRADPDVLDGKDESALIIALGPHLDGFLGELFGIEHDLLGLARQTHALDPVHACKRLFVQRQAVKKHADPSGFDGPALRRDLEARFGEPLTELAFANHVAEWEKDGDADALDLAHALRRLGDADRSRPRGAPRRHAVRDAAQAGLQPPGAGGDDRARRRHHAAPAGAPLAAARGLRADRSRHEHPAGAGPGQLLHLVPHPGQGLLQPGPEGPQDRRVPEVAVRRDPGRLSAGREDLRDAHVARPGQRAGRLRHGGHRQPDDGGHRPPHLQRLHEGLHLPEAGPGRYPAGGDLHPEGHAGPALGLRDLRAADAVEPAGPAPPAAAPGQRPQGACRRPRAGRVHPGAPPDERRPHRRRHRRPEDRAARHRPGRAGARRGNAVREPGRPGDGRVRRRRRVRHHRALEQELPEAGPPAAGTSRAVRPFRRRALRRHAEHGRRLGDGLRPHRAVHGRRQADRAGHPERPGARRARGVGLPDGAATDRRGEAVLHRQPAAAPAGGGDRRRPDGDRHRNRKPGVLCAPGGEIRRALPHAGGGTRRGRRAPQLEPGGSRHRRRVPGACRRHRRGTRRRRDAKAARRASPSCWTAGAAPPSPIAAG